MWETLIFKVISAAENPISSQKKTRFWKEKSGESVVTFAGLPLTLGPTEQATLVETDRRLTLNQAPALCLLRFSSSIFVSRLLRVFGCSSGANGASNPLQEQQAGGIGKQKDRGSRDVHSCLVALSE